MGNGEAKAIIKPVIIQNWQRKWEEKLHVRHIHKAHGCDRENGLFNKLKQKGGSGSHQTLHLHLADAFNQRDLQ